MSYRSIIIRNSVPNPPDIQTSEYWPGEVSNGGKIHQCQGCSALKLTTSDCKYCGTEGESDYKPNNMNYGSIWIS